LHILYLLVYRAAGLPCIVLNGINKSAAYQLGKPIDRRAMLAQWNAVYVDGQWRLLDVFWASTCLVGRHSADWALLDSDGELVDCIDDDNAEVRKDSSRRFWFRTSLSLSQSEIS